jgi:hypothetical protein
MIMPGAADKVQGIPQRGPVKLCAWLTTYAQRLRDGIYTASRTRARSELVWHHKPGALVGCVSRRTLC